MEKQYKELTIELIDKVLTDFKKKYKNNFMFYIIGDYDKVTKEIETFNSIVIDNLTKFWENN